MGVLGKKSTTRIKALDHLTIILRVRFLSKIVYFNIRRFNVDHWSVLYASLEITYPV